MNVTLPQKSSKTPGYFLYAWLCIAVLAVVSMAFVTPPFQSPDEIGHFFRAYQVSEGTLLADVDGGMSGGYLPVSLEKMTLHFVGGNSLHAALPQVRPMPVATTFSGIDRPLDAGTRAFLDFSLQSFYSPLVYAAPSLAMSVGRQAGAGPRTLFYLARLANGLGALAILFCALWLLPFGRELVGFIVLMPMPVSLYASCSGDAMTIATACLFSALILNRMAADTWDSRDTIVAIVCGTTFCSIKPTYFPLLLLGFVGIFFTQKRRATIQQQALVAGISLIATVLWFRLASPAFVYVREGTNVSAQIRYVLGAPFTYALTMAHTLRWSDFFYLQLVGTLGWLSIRLPLAAYLLPPLALLAAWGSEQRVPPRGTALVAACGTLIIAASCVLMLTAIYVSWTPVGANHIEGFQGRYFLPVAPLAGLMFLSVCGRKQYWSQSTTQVIILGLIGAEACISLWTISARFAVF